MNKEIAKITKKTTEIAALVPIGTFHCRERYPYDAARQGSLTPGNTGEIRLLPGQNFEQALTGLDGFSRIWLVYLFHHNPNWKPMIRPPRGSGGKVGVFASRAPYRPNPIGLSCVELIGIRGRSVWVRGHDLLDGTPILDLKPYVPYADSFPDATTGWLADRPERTCTVCFGPVAERQLLWLEAQGVNCLRGFLLRQLARDPTDATRKRVGPVADGGWEIAYRTWRARFQVDETAAAVTVERVRSGYSRTDLAATTDRYHDKAVHRAFNRKRFGGGTREQVISDQLSVVRIASRKSRVAGHSSSVI